MKTEKEIEKEIEKLISNHIEANKEYYANSNFPEIKWRDISIRDLREIDDDFKILEARLDERQKAKSDFLKMIDECLKDDEISFGGKYVNVEELKSKLGDKK